jgi:hypothetical protein
MLGYKHRNVGGRIRAISGEEDKRPQIWERPLNVIDRRLATMPVTTLLRFSDEDTKIPGQHGSAIGAAIDAHHKGKSLLRQMASQFPEDRNDALLLIACRDDDGVAHRS